MSDQRWQPGERVRVLWGEDEGTVGTVVGHDRGFGTTTIHVDVPTGGVVTLWVDDVMLGPEDEGGGSVREPRRPVGPDDALGAEAPL